MDEMTKAQYQAKINEYVKQKEAALTRLGAATIDVHQLDGAIAALTSLLNEPMGVSE